MQNLVLTRIDDRLIHGQVMTKWLKETEAQNVLIIDDATAKNDFMINVFEQAIPEDVGIGVFNKEDGVKFLSQPLEAPTLILVKVPETVEYLIDHGIDIKDVDLGGMGAKEGRTTLYQYISTSPEEDKCFKRLIDKGVNVYVQIVPQNEKEPIEPLINKKEK
ncbi:PTS system mannose/fructose/N-acetylgalactosamine-transporter subunit IIB [Lactobacillus crispatus]|jgi:PTS system sorbose subfamily IIB component|uniref:PTS mannose/fructose/sorbose transporter subunit IIB n=1 Tax=Lactobacillus crispatus TaxID=47770 RepID=A0A135ZGL5_9LACO|nr:PTS sugar transporter subunit IIB [Lactobacillus crispatus]KWU14000.1 PTS mannose transporter subunit IID [Lactobacillus crispatus]KXI20843.1 PTS system sorbose subfamily IIB component [Lactobacillus crispatus]MCT7697249.1 PTS sugar transporter subunit IIB [Lactobacillus crispatus]MCT7708712.1 PTS sugar transporter subunit IIB [Lactobacillus crispatus]MCZ9662236.1 PTS sugar transporter subunit IIB [Lactobacillus crispatus]